MPDQDHENWRFTNAIYLCSIYDCHKGLKRVTA